MEDWQLPAGGGLRNLMKSYEADSHQFGVASGSLIKGGCPCCGYRAAEVEKEGAQNDEVESKLQECKN